MTLKKHVVDDYFTASPYTVQADDDVQRAQELMSQHGIRHLPVMDHGELGGVLSDRDIKAALALKGASTKRLRCADIASEGAYVTHPGSALELVAREMAEKHYGSAVVTDKGEVVGIFTTTDACRALADVLTGG